MARASSYPLELRQRTARMVVEPRADYDSEFEAIGLIAATLGIGSAETLRKCPLPRAEIDTGARPRK